MIFVSNSAATTMNFAQNIASNVSTNKALTIYLSGNLGAGKTTFARGFISYFAFNHVKSPSYSIVESYNNKDITIHHLDFYRINDPDELNYIGIREYFDDICLIEWAELARSVIKPADIIVELPTGNNKRISVTTKSTIGQDTIKKC